MLRSSKSSATQALAVARRGTPLLHIHGTVPATAAGAATGAITQATPRLQAKKLQGLEQGTLTFLRLLKGKPKERVYKETLGKNDKTKGSLS